MTSAQSDAPQGATTQTLADALREVADWLDAHPEVKPERAFVPIAASAREDLETLAAALGERATEQVTYGDRVQINGRFAGPDEWSGVRVYGEVPVDKLMDEPQPRPKYRPILPVKEGSES